MKIYPGILIFIACVAFVSCETLEPENFENTHPKLIYQVYHDSILTNEYTYNTDSQILEVKSKLQYTRHTYDQGKLISTAYYVDPGMFSSSWDIVQQAHQRTEWVNASNTELSDTKTYAYAADGRLKKVSTRLGEIAVQYDGSGRISRELFYHEAELNGYIQYAYDERGNVLSRVHFIVQASGEEVLQTTTEYQVDRQHNPYHAFRTLMMSGINTNPNNITRETYTIHFEVPGVSENVSITTNSYQYDDQGYPILKNESVRYVYY